MNELNELPGTELLAAVQSDRVSVAEIAESCLQRINEREPLIRAFAHHDPELVRRSAAALDRNRTTAPLRGLPVGIKDLVDTADQPSEFGSPICSGRRPSADAAIVRHLRTAGALIVGKTVSTEFALFHPGCTTNPHDTKRTPGGSSSGSAAATADNMLAVAIGTQTAGSIIRPASFCGVVGFKPTFGAIDRNGVKLISPTLDTVGLFARSVSDIKVVFRAVREESAKAAPAAPTAATRRRVGFIRTAEWQNADQETQLALESLASDLAGRGYDIVEATLPTDFEQLIAAQVTVMEVEVANSLRIEYDERQSLLSDSAGAVIERGRARSGQEYDRAMRLASRCRSALREVFHDLDGLLTPAVVGVAPTGLTFTGDPLFCRAWTLLHCPALSLPMLRGSRGLPIGAQIVGLPGADDSLLQLAGEIMSTASDLGSGSAMGSA